MRMVVLEEIEQLLDKLDGASVLDSTDVESREFFERWVKVRNRVDAQMVRAAKDLEERAIPARDGLRLDQWIAHRSRCPKAEAARLARAARHLQRLPQASEALRSGDIGFAAADLMLRHCTRRLQPEIEAAEATLTGYAKTLDHSQFSHAVDHWHNVVAPEHTGRVDDLIEDRGAHLVETFGGAWHLEGVGDPVSGTELAGALACFVDHELDTDWADARTRIGDTATAADLARTSRQRTWDALVAMARRASSAVGGTEPKPLIHVLVDQAVLTAHLARSAGADIPVPEGDCRLASGTPLNGDQLIALAADAFVRRVVLDPNGVILDVGRRRRLFAGPLREALLAIVPTCRFPGCDRPALRSQVDHIDRYADDGPTHPANGQACCRHHNRLKEKGFRSIRGPDHTITWHRPDGTRLE